MGQAFIQIVLRSIVHFPMLSFSYCDMFNRPYENMSTAYASELLSRNASAATVKCGKGWVYDRSQYETSITMEVGLCVKV